MHYRGLKAIDGIDISIRPPEILGLIGPNGAGKSTLLNALTHVAKRTDGRFFLDGVDVTRYDTRRLIRSGLVRTFQNPRLFSRLTVRENIVVAGLGRRLSDAAARREADAILERIQLTALRDVEAGSLSYGQERIVSIGRALASGPRFLLLDEPAAGLSESETDELMEVIVGIRRDVKCAVVIIEHDMRLIMNVCERIHVLDHGTTLAVGTPQEVRADPLVIQAYLGV